MPFFDPKGPMTPVPMPPVPPAPPAPPRPPGPPGRGTGTAPGTTSVPSFITGAPASRSSGIRAAVTIDPTEAGVPSTKGTLTQLSESSTTRLAPGNCRLVQAFQRVGGNPRLTGDHDVLARADGLVVPGVGAFPEAMRRLRAAGLDELVRERAGVPVIGLCLGMQLLFERSVEHGGATGLGLLPGEVVRLDSRGLSCRTSGGTS